jgi:hypothetical protein
MRKIKILCIHGIGGQDLESNKFNALKSNWLKAFSEANLAFHKDDIHFMPFDKHFKLQNADLNDYILLFYDTFLKRVTKQKNQKLFGIKKWFDNFPDMVVEFLQDHDGLRNILRTELKNHITQYQPDIIYAHSLGTLMCYDFFTQEENKKGFDNIILITSGSQLGNPLLAKHNLQIPVVDLPVKFWYNLHNPKDLVFAKNSLQANQIQNYKELKTEFIDRINFNHTAEEYIKHKNTISEVWKNIVL